MRYSVRTCSADLTMPRIPAGDAVEIEADNPIMAATIALDVGELWIPEEHGCTANERLLAALVWPEKRYGEQVNVYFPQEWEAKLS